MCCCGKPTINGEPNAYSWDGKTFGTHPVFPPALADGDELLCDLPGRCGGLDSHSHHLRIVSNRIGGWALLVRHGGGEERIPLDRTGVLIEPLPAMTENNRYWFVLRLYHVVKNAMGTAASAAEHKWRTAAAEGRIKTRKQRGQNAVKVWIA